MKPLCKSPWIDLFGDCEDIETWWKQYIETPMKTQTENRTAFDPLTATTEQWREKREQDWNNIRTHIQQLTAQRDALRSALQALVDCPDYRHIKTHEMHMARAALALCEPKDKEKGAW